MKRTPIILVFIITASCGCGSQDEPEIKFVARSETASISATKNSNNVLNCTSTINDKIPMPRGYIVVYPDQSSAQPSASGAIEPDGSCRIGNMPIGRVFLLVKEHLDSKAGEDYKRVVKSHFLAELGPHHVPSAQSKPKSSPEKTATPVGLEFRGDIDMLAPLSNEFQAFPEFKYLIEAVFEDYGNRERPRFRIKVGEGENHCFLHLKVNTTPHIDSDHPNQP